MSDIPIQLNERIPDDTTRYLSSRLDGARGLYLLALALGTRGEGYDAFGRMIREARVHFAAVLEEARLAGLDTTSIAAVLSEAEVGETLRPEVRAWIEEIMSRRGQPQ
jgi:hypothetical protein